MYEITASRLAQYARDSKRSLDQLRSRRRARITRHFHALVGRIDKHASIMLAGSLISITAAAHA